MIALRRLLPALFTAVLGIAAAPATPSGATSRISVAFPQRLKIVTYGGSPTSGVGATSPAAAYPAQLQAILRRLMPPDRTITVDNRGTADATLAAISMRLEREIIDQHPDLVVLETGSTEAANETPVAHFEDDLRQAVARLRRAGIAVILLEPQGCPGLEDCMPARPYRDAMRRFGVVSHVPLVRRATLTHDWISRGLVTRRELLSSDGMNLGDQGYTVLASWVASEILKLRAFTNADGLTSRP